MRYNPAWMAEHGPVLDRVRKSALTTRLGLRQLQSLRAVQSSLRFLDQCANALCVRLGVAVAGKRVGAATRFNQDVRPDEARLDMDGGDLGEVEANLVLAEPRALVSDDRPVRHHNDRGEQVIPARPAARAKTFRIHAVTVTQETGVCHTVFTPCAPAQIRPPHRRPARALRQEVQRNALQRE
jgi:hypothetical protein